MKVDQMREELEKFLETRGRDAFTITINPERMSYQIDDLSLDFPKIMGQWDGLVSKAFNIPSLTQ